MFHCLEHTGEGGKTLLVDGFNAAEKLRKDNPEAFNLLTSTIVPHEYIDKGKDHLYSLGTVLSTDMSTGKLTQIRSVIYYYVSCYWHTATVNCLVQSNSATAALVSTGWVTVLVCQFLC